MRKSKKILIAGTFIAASSMLWLFTNDPVLLFIQFGVGTGVMLYSIHYLIEKE